MAEDDDVVTVSWSKRHAKAVLDHIQHAPEGVDPERWQGVVVGMASRPWRFNGKSPEQVHAMVLAAVGAVGDFLAAEGAKS